MNWVEIVMFVVQLACCVLACASIIVATRVHKHMQQGWADQEIAARLKDIEKIHAVEWKPGMILWISSNLQDDGENAKAYLEKHGLGGAPFLLTHSGVDIQSISVVDLLGLIGHASQDETA